MTSRDFCYWLQGFFELRRAGMNPTEVLTAAQIVLIEKHLALVFEHEIDPGMGSVEHQKKLTEIHHGPFPPGPVILERIKDLAESASTGVPPKPPTHEATQPTVPLYVGPYRDVPQNTCCPHHMRINC